jgi:hypothetical protein
MPPEKIDQEIGIKKERLHYSARPRPLGSRRNAICLTPNSSKIGQILAPPPETSRALDDARSLGCLALTDEPVDCIPDQFALCAACSCSHGLKCLLLRGAKINFVCDS